MSADARLAARPAPATTVFPADSPMGLHELAVGGTRDSYVFVSNQYKPETPAPLVLLLHGAGGHAHDGLRVLLHLADQAGLILIAPSSRRNTWDIIAGRSYGPDRDLADRALNDVFARYHVDATRLAVGGFSDGASYALSLGLANGDLFSHILAFSPGFIGPLQARGEPKVFISHGTEDPILPIDPCSRRIVRQLRAAGYPLRYEEFEGEHVIPPEIAQAALSWFSGA
ncbi:phospholipase [Massilia sp. IC2-477]|uniref:alpha/beta hydrolase n=1 Tax=Massilia sp. IC2-477 TaxID=2887198 RepID=UPI001D103881|nr:alpha/beta hydrolase-fold protein [Massilia sp. IC2-477]MCC2955587.1 phospholipase [Massilia sp. IC2-477]